MVKTKPVSSLKTLEVGIDDITPHPASPRRGDIAMIASSLASHGQYRPITVNARDGKILKGNNTYAAAKKLGWGKIAVVMVDVDEDHALRIILADNRASDLASYNVDTLAGVLKELPDLDGTGFDLSDLGSLGSDDVQPGQDPPTEVGRGGRKAESSFVIVKVGQYKWGVDAEVLESWESAVMVEAKEVKAEAVRIVRNRLGIPPEPKTRRKKQTAESTPDHVLGVHVVPIASLVPWEPNPREGDVGMITESLSVNGQYAPIVVQKSTNRVIVGNHTLRAAEWLGWAEISVTFIDVTDDEATRIMLVDNRTSDVSEYDGELLKKSLLAVSSFDGTGFSDDDVDDIFKGYSTKPSPKQRKGIRCSFANIKFTVKRDTFFAWSNALVGERVERELNDRLGIPAEACEFPQ